MAQQPTVRQRLEQCLAQAIIKVDQLTEALEAQAAHLKAEPPLPTAPAIMDVDQVLTYGTARHAYFKWKNEVPTFEYALEKLRKEEGHIIGELRTYNMPANTWVLYDGMAVGIRTPTTNQGPSVLVIHPASGVLPSLT